MAFTTCFSRFLFLSAILLSPSVSSCFSLGFSESCIRARGGSSALRPSPCCPRHGVRLPREPQRGNAGSDFELSYHWNTFLEVRWDCVSRSRSRSLTLTLTLTLLLSLSLSLSRSLRNLSDCPSARTHAHFLPSHLSHALSPSSPSASSSSSSLCVPLCLIFFLFVIISSSSSPPLLLLCVFLLCCRLLLICFRLS